METISVNENGKLNLMGIVFSVMIMLVIIIPANVSAQPYPASDLITGITFGDPVKVSESRAGDNWPITWAWDGNMYTSWGDGQGPDHPNGTRVSMGWAKVKGDPPDIMLVDTKSSQKTTGDGRYGYKGSGMLMVDDILYMWVRNANQNGEHCRLWWSGDLAKTWTQADWSFTEFGYLTFINYGLNYSGARDNYIYSVSHNHPNAYFHADDFILMRVLKDRITDRGSYEFFAGFDDDGNPNWSSAIREIMPVFHHANRCNRSGISYNAQIGRYLWWHGGWPSPTDAKDSRFNPAPLGIYEAPEPWGPWRTVYYNEKFESPGEAGSFPPKWMGEAEGGRQLIYMLGSHDDAFTLWPVTLILGK
jgi:hypothetical protein